MRILYISIGHVAEGVKQKLTDKAISLRDQGVDVIVCWVASNVLVEKEGFQVSIPVNQSRAQFIGRLVFFWRLSVMAEQYKIYKTLRSYLQNQTFDFLLLRYPVSDYFLWRFVSTYRGKIIFEHNTIEKKELNIRQSDSFYYRYFEWGEQIFGKKVRKLAAGLIGVTPEITQWQDAISNNVIPCCTITNGIDVMRVKERKENPFAGDELRFVLLAGSAAPWHGIDILLDSIERYKGKTKLHCCIAGNVTPEVRDRIQANKNVTLLPHQTGEQLDRLIDDCHIGIGSLGFKNSFLTQASSLKVREYWSRGLPFVLGYDDADLIDNSKMIPFYLKVPAESPIDMEGIVSFAKRVYSIPHVSHRMRGLALDQIHYPVKTSAYIQFLKGLLK